MASMATDGLIPLHMLTDVPDWPQARLRDALLIRAPDGAGEDWPHCITLPASTPFQMRHGAGCACCSREPAVMTLAAVFQERVMGKRPPFREVVLVMHPEERHALRDILENDVLVRARYRLAGQE
ncbi:hypothetical protein GMO_07900 [Gluconobacter morbifer G707]|uniref:Uncharacterized protein n=2 Tax=Gluconobacter TaxID=441 RepID=G6XH25_9PROT|nr:hypothetical protein GMO_07900 [Gluconobacter morbifer G707]